MHLKEQKGNKHPHKSIGMVREVMDDLTFRLFQVNIRHITGKKYLKRDYVTLVAWPHECDNFEIISNAKT